MDKTDLLDKIIPVLEAMPEVTLAYLFGSQATGNAGPMSDIDLALLFSEGTDFYRTCAQIAHEVAKALFPYRVDVIPLEKAPIELAHKVIDQGICIHLRDLAARVEYEAKVMGLYGDYLPYLRQQREDILQGGKRERRVQRYREAFRRTERTLSQIAAVKE